MTTDYTQLAQKIASIARTEHAANVVVLDIKEMVAFTDYFVIASGRSTVQVKSIAERVEDELLGMGIRPSRRDGYNEGRW
ncbi:MAG: ribosome silencing factor, partial [Chitinophagales bacterium]